MSHLLDKFPGKDHGMVSRNAGLRIHRDITMRGNAYVYRERRFLSRYRRRVLYVRNSAWFGLVSLELKYAARVNIHGAHAAMREFGVSFNLMTRSACHGGRGGGDGRYVHQKSLGK